jgi:hydroxyacylglutathione hydrolase
MLFRQRYQRDLAQASYLIGCQVTGEALVVDPNRDLQQYLDLAAQEGVRITAVTETHIHADFVSGARELAARTGATLYLSDVGPAEWKYAFAAEAGARLLHDGDHFQVGNVDLEVWHTPGHTPEHLSFLVTDRAHTDLPMGLLSGDFVFVGDVGRPDLLERAAGITGTMETAALQLFMSLQRFKTLPEYVQVWPAHGAGSACGKALGAVPQSTVGYEKQVNWALRMPDRDAFLREVLAGQPDPPTYFARMKRVNRDGPPMLPRSELAAFDATAYPAALGQDALLLDLRAPAAFSAGHLPGALNLAMDGAFLTWAGWLIPEDRPLALIGTPAEAQAAARRLQLIGLDHVLGYWTPDLVSAWAEQGHTLATIARVTPTEARAVLATDSPTVLDVRFASEYAAGHLDGSLHIPLGSLPHRLDEVPRERPVLVHCQGGVRSPIAASLLTGTGYPHVYDLIGGYEGWRQAPPAPPLARTTVCSQRPRG